VLCYGHYPERKADSKITVSDQPIVDTIQSMLSLNPGNRPSVKELLEDQNIPPVSICSETIKTYFETLSEDSKKSSISTENEETVGLKVGDLIFEDTSEAWRHPETIDDRV